MKRILLLVCLFAVGGCSSTSFVGRRFDNFTAYYNTFYNAKRAYRDAVKTVQQPDKAIDRTTYLLVFDPGTRGSGTNDFENAIKKSADVLRGHPDSKWVDDALLLIGKSYYYMGNTVGAQQKFREVIDRASGLEDEARFWLGLSLISGGALDEATSHLQGGIDRENVPRKWEARMRLALGEVYVREERWEEAAEQLSLGTTHADDDELAGRAQFLLGQVLETIGDYEGAARGYSDVKKFQPRYELSYAAKFSAVRVVGEHGQPDDALSELRKMERDDKNFAYRAELDYLRGRVLKANQRSEDAFNVFYDVLYDSDANVSTIRGPTHYHLGLLFRDQFIDFDRAAAHFDTAATALTRGNRTSASDRSETLASAPYAITDAAELADVFGKFAEFHAEIQHYDSLLALGSLEGEAFRERIEEIRRQLAEEIVEERREQARRAAEAGFRGAVTDAGRPTGNTGGRGEDYATAGFLYHRDRSRVQDGLLAFFDRWGERPLVANWRRSAAISSGSGTASQETAETADEQAQIAVPISGDVTTEALLSSVEVDISEIPRTPERQAEMKRLRAAARYELANVLFLSIGLPDSAAVWYRRVLDEAEDREIRARALYALAEVQQSLSDEESAAAIYQQVVDEYPDSEVAARSAQRLGIAETELISVEADTLSSRYRSAFDLWVGGAFEQSMRSMLSLAASKPDTVAAGRALLAAGAIYVDWAETRGRDILEPIGIPVADSIWSTLGLLDTRISSDSVAGQVAQPDSAASDISWPVQAEADGALPDSVAAISPSDSVGAAQTADPKEAIIVAAEGDSTGAATADSILSVVPTLPDSASDSVGAAISPYDSVGATQTADLKGAIIVAAEGDSTDGATADSILSAVPTLPDSASVDSVVTATSFDRSALSADTLREAADTEAVSIVEVSDARPNVFLVDLYRVVTSRYPGSDYAQKASALVAALEERLQERQAQEASAADSLVASTPLGPDSLAVPGGEEAPVSSRAADSLGMEVPHMVADSLAEAETASAVADSIQGSARAAVGDDEDDTRAPPIAPDRGVDDQAVADTVVFEEADSMPVLVGGEGALERMFRYPDTAAEGGVTGRVLVSFEVDQHGRVVDPFIVTSVGAGCDEEAERVIKLSRYQPATIDGRPVRFRMTAHVECAPRSGP